MKTITFLLLISLNLLSAEIKHETLKSISQYSIKIGNGKTYSAYIFVDPMCKHSRTLIKKIRENKLLQLINTYHIFLYKLPKYESDKINQHIYQADDKLKELYHVMTEGINFELDLDLDNFKANDKTYQELKEVEKVAKEFKMKLRPYTIKFDNTTGYCTVSEGIASCMEEFDFE